MMSNMRRIDREHVYLYVVAVALMFDVYMQWWPLAVLKFIISIRQSIVCAVLSAKDGMQQNLKSESEVTR